MIQELKSREEIINSIIKELDNSDIVWTRYGADTKEALAERILNRVLTKED